VKKIPVFLTTGILILTASFSFSQQEYVEGKEVLTLSGRVESVNPSGSTIVVKDVNEVRFQVPPDAKLVKDIYDIKLSDINTGDYVTVEYYTASSGSNIVTRISVDYSS